MAVIVNIPKTIAQEGAASAASWAKNNEEFLQKVFKVHQAWLDDEEVAKLQAAYDGEMESVDIREKSRGDDVNHKLQVNYAQIIIDTVVDYMLGKPISWTVSPDEDLLVPEALSNSYRKELLGVLRGDESQRVLSEQLRQGSIAAMAFILCWVDENGQIKYDEFPVQEVIPVLDARGQLRLLLRKYLLEDGDDKYTILEVYDDRFLTVYQGDENGKDFEILKYDDASPNPVDHKAARIPVSLFVNGRPARYEKRVQLSGVSDLANGVFTLLEDLAHTLSDKANTADRLQDQLLLMTGVTLGNTKEQAEAEVMAMRRARALALKSADSKAAFIAPSQEDTAVENYVDRLVSVIHDATFIPKLNDITGTTAMEVRMKYSSLDIKAGKKETYFTEAVKSFIAVITDMLNVKRLTLAGDPDPWATITAARKPVIPGQPLPAKPKVDLYDAAWLEFTINRNLPQNYTEIATIVSMLAGIVPDTYLYELLWFIEDPKAALDEMKAQKDEDAKRALEAMGTGSDLGNTDDNEE